MTTSVTRSRENTRARLLDAAAQLFAEVGLDGASVEVICERAGFTRGAFYSNFESKDELFLELASTIAERRLTGVRERIDAFVAAGVLTGDADPVSMVQKVLDDSVDDRLSVLLLSEVRIRALRDAVFGAAYAAQEDAMLESIVGIIQGIVDSGLFTLRVDVQTAARTLMIVWEGTMVRGAIAGHDGELLHHEGGQALARLVELIIEDCTPPAGG
ncbi:MAG: TetR/AcrR family transcriptional regulator [Actinomycetota bacterium]